MLSIQKCGAHQTAENGLAFPKFLKKTLSVQCPVPFCGFSFWYYSYSVHTHSSNTIYLPFAKANALHNALDYGPLLKHTLDK
jgi:hypothetical protein